MSYNTATLNHGPLTTLFTPPASCASTTINERPSGLPPFIFQALSGGIPPGGDAKFSTYKKCYPSTTSNAENIDNWAEFWYSPGVCPSGWPAACQMTQFPVGSVDTMSVFPTETRGVVCCPSGWSCITCAEGSPTPTMGPSGIACLPAMCQKLFTSGQVVTGYGVSQSSTITTTLDLVDGSNYNYMTGVPVMWESTDQAVLKILSAGTDSIALSVNNAAGWGIGSSSGGGNLASTTGEAQISAAGTTTGSSSNAASTSGIASNSGTASDAGTGTVPQSLFSGGTFSSHPLSLPTSTSGAGTSGGINNAATANPSSGLSAGTKAAIGITIPVFILALIFGLFLYMRRRNTPLLGRKSDGNRERKVGKAEYTNIAAPSLVPSGVHELPTWAEEQRRSGRQELAATEKRAVKDEEKIYGLQVEKKSDVNMSDAARLSAPFVVEVTR